MTWWVPAEQILWLETVRLLHLINDSRLIHYQNCHGYIFCWSNYWLISYSCQRCLIAADGSWKKILQMDFLLNMHECVLISLPSEWKEALLAGCERRDRRNNRGQILMKTLWEHRWRETAPRRLMCGWVTATSGAGLTQPISRRDTSASLQRQTTISMNDWA